MKKVTFLLTGIALVTLWSCGGEGSKSEKDSSEKTAITIQKESYKPGEKDALIVLKAYSDKDLET